MSDHKHTNEKDLLRIFERTGCLTEKVLLDYVHDRLSPLERKRAEEHLLDCRLCSDAIEGVGLLQEAEFSGYTAELRQLVGEMTGAGTRKVIRLKPWRIAAAASIVGILAVSGWAVSRLLNERSDDRAVIAFEKNFDTPLAPAVEEPLRVETEQPALTAEGLADGASVEGIIEAKDLMPSEAEEAVTRESDEAVVLDDISKARAEAPDVSVASDSTVTSASGNIAVTGGTNYNYTWTAPATSSTETLASKGRTTKEDLKVDGTRDNKAATAGAVNISDNDVVTQARLEQGITDYSNQQYSQAIDNLGQVLEVEPDNETALFYSAISHIEQKQPAQAISNLDKILRNKGSAYYDSAQWYRAMALLQAGQSKAARKQLTEIVESGNAYQERARKALEDF